MSTQGLPKSLVLKETKTCKTCGQAYEAHIGRVMGIEIMFGGGSCPTCCKKMSDEEDNRFAEAERKKVSDTRELWRKECGIPPRFRDSRFDKFDKRVDRSILKMWRECQEYTNKFSCRNPQISKSLVMYSTGVWGVGKTYLACSIANAVLDKWNKETLWCPVMFVSEPDLFMRIRATYNQVKRDVTHETEEGIYKKLATVPLLILDDVGKEEVSDARFVQRVLFGVIDRRYQNMLPIVITANLKPEELDYHLGGSRGNNAAMDRLVEMTGSTFWELHGESYRDVTKRQT